MITIPTGYHAVDTPAETQHVGEGRSAGRSASSPSMRISDRTARSASFVCFVLLSFRGSGSGGARGARSLRGSRPTRRCG